MAGVENKIKNAVSPGRMDTVSAFRPERPERGEMSPGQLGEISSRSVTGFGSSASKPAAKPQVPSSPAQESSGPVDSFGKDRLYEAYNDLHALAQVFSKQFDAPAILVVGHQTDGKSGAGHLLLPNSGSIPDAPPRVQLLLSPCLSVLIDIRSLKIASLIRDDVQPWWRL
jgi:hypothetical protein